MSSDFHVRRGGHLALAGERFQIERHGGPAGMEIRLRRSHDRGQYRLRTNGPGKGDGLCEVVGVSTGHPLTAPTAPGSSWCTSATSSRSQPPRTAVTA